MVDFVDEPWYYNEADSETHWVGDFRWGWISNWSKMLDILKWVWYTTKVRWGAKSFTANEIKKVVDKQWKIW